MRTHEQWKDELLEREPRFSYFPVTEAPRPGLFQSWWGLIGGIASLIGWAVLILIGWFIRSRM